MNAKRGDDGYRGEDWLIREIDRKADDTKVDSVMNIAVEAKDIALAAKKRAYMEHPCRQEETIASWTKWWRGTLVTIILGLIGGIGTVAVAMYKVGSLSQEVSETKRSVESLQRSVVGLERSQEDLKYTFETSQKTERIRHERQIDDVKQAVKDAIIESGDAIASRKSTRR